MSRPVWAGVAAACIGSALLGAGIARSWRPPETAVVDRVLEARTAAYVGSTVSVRIVAIAVRQHYQVRTRWLPGGTVEQEQIAEVEQSSTETTAAETKTAATETIKAERETVAVARETRDRHQLGMRAGLGLDGSRSWGAEYRLRVAGPFWLGIWADYPTRGGASLSVSW